ncbi:hypothetical protein NDU88_001363 [Pleurodeles waltl]|uniref:Uncharacterized protein n=1 Tax=Pleurodeles waltl TaxID=8319 RepID=A0AAV7WLJ4_PLEWA|nr:hypothetical protein NDU88_001363 [Pleurodeles waltl]
MVPCGQIGGSLEAFPTLRGSPRVFWASRLRSGRVAPLPREELSSAQESGCGRGAARGAAWAVGRAFPSAALADKAPGIEGRGAHPGPLKNWRSPRDPAPGGWST